jgi:hypothetical protein
MLRKVAGENLPVRQAGTGNGGQYCRAIYRAKV